MTRGPRLDLLRATLRANPAYELLLFDRLPAGQRGVLAGLTRDPEMYGVLKAREGEGLPVQSLSCDTALLFLTLAQPGHAPAYLERKLGARAAEVLLQLVVERILEVELGERFVSGAAAHALLFGAEGPADGAGDDGPLARLSVTALRDAAALDVDDALRLTAWLYAYNGYPRSPRHRRELPDDAAVTKHLGLAVGPLATVLDRGWVPLTPDGEGTGWRVWRPRRLRAGRGADGGGSAQIVYKLYLSPAWEATREAFHAGFGVLADSPPFQIKMGRDLGGLLRPDKLVAYFASFEALGEAAERLRAALSGCAAQGVPFTAGIGEDALLSWGLDPPPRAEAAPWQERESWRLWVTQRLASALLATRGVEGVEPVRFALERLSLEGFDGRSFTPSPRIWREAPRQD